MIVPLTVTLVLSFFVVINELRLGYAAIITVNKSIETPTISKGDNIARYRTTDDLLTAIRSLCSKCAYADTEWTNVKSYPLWADRLSADIASFNAVHNSVLTVTLTHAAKERNAIRRAGGSVPVRITTVAVFGEHGRERITSELAYNIIKRVCDSADGGIDLRQYEFVLLPLVNEGGRRIVETGHFCWRLNARGVDLNRNYKQAWGIRDKTTVDEEERCGHAPLSEFEVRAVDAVVQRFDTHAYVSVHSGGVAVLTPWDGNTNADAAIPSWIENAARYIAHTHCGECPVGTALRTFGYRAYGTGVDHMLSIRHVPLALTVEVFGGDDQHCHKMFNPTTYAQFGTVMANWSTVLHTVASILSRHPREIVSKPLDSTSQVKQDILRIAASWSHGSYRVDWIPDNEHYSLGFRTHLQQRQIRALRSHFSPLAAMAMISFSIPGLRAFRKRRFFKTNSVIKRSRTNLAME